MTDDQKARLKAVQTRQREAHQKLFELQGATIDALRDALDAVARTQDEMSKFQYPAAGLSGSCGSCW